jgi:hypothetical protein
MSPAGNFTVPWSVWGMQHPSASTARWNGGMLH